MNEVVTTTVGLVVGLLTGYYFEWRNSRATRVQNAELEKKLHVLRESIYSVSSRDVAAEHDVGTADLEMKLLRWIKDYQGPDGSVGRARVIERFSNSGFSVSEIIAALTRLDEQGHLELGEEIFIR